MVGGPELCGGNVAVANLVDDDIVRRIDTDGSKQLFAANLVHGQCRCHHTAAGIRHAKPLQCALQGTVLTARAMQRNPDTVETRTGEFDEIPFRGIPAAGIDATCLQCREDRLAGVE